MWIVDSAICPLRRMHSTLRMRGWRLWIRQMPKLAGIKTTEVVDKYTNKKHVADQKQVLQERKLDYYWEKLVPEMVNSGTYTLETMLEKGWVYYDEKKNLVTRTKPPQKS
jgi:hypothetical protein